MQSLFECQANDVFHCKNLSCSIRSIVYIHQLYSLRVIGFYVRAVLDAIVKSNKTCQWVKVHMEQTSDNQVFWSEGQTVAMQKPKRKTSQEISTKATKGAAKSRDRSSPIISRREKNKM